MSTLKGTDEDDAQVLQWFREFLAIPTCEPKPDYHGTQGRDEAEVDSSWPSRSKVIQLRWLSCRRLRSRRTLSARSSTTTPRGPSFSSHGSVPSPRSPACCSTPTRTLFLQCGYVSIENLSKRPITRADSMQEFWHSDPFTPLVRDNRDIVARGTQGTLIGSRESFSI